MENGCISNISFLSFFGWFSTEPWLWEKGYVKLWNITLYTLTSMVWKLHVWRGWSISIPPIFHLCHGMALKSNFPSKLNSIFVCPVIGQHPTRNLAFKPLRPFGYLAQKKNTWAIRKPQKQIISQKPVAGPKIRREWPHTGPIFR